MAANRIYVTVYKLECFDNYDALDSFIESICDCAIISKECDYSLTIVASSEILNTSKICNVAIRFFGKEGYVISTLGMLGPFVKKS